MTGILAPPPVNESSTRVDADRLVHPIVERRRMPQFKRGFNSVFVISFAMYVAANLYMSFAAPIDFDPYKYIYKGWCWWIFNDLKQHPETHNVALLGSSLVVSAVSGTDANFLNSKIDLTKHHKACYLDSRLEAKFGGKFNTFNLSAPGQMPSDAFMILKGMINTADRPEVIIYGIAPRDFIDSTLSSPVDTEPFHYIKRIVNLDDVSSALFRSPLAKLDFWLQKSVYFYQYSLDFEMATTEFVTKKLASLLPPDQKHPFTWWDRVRMMPNYLPGEIHPEAVISSPMTREASHQHFVDNTVEYMERYKRPDRHIYKTQFIFLDKLAEYCRREKIELVLVNMPITRQNVGILKPTVYLNYIQALRNWSFFNNFLAYDLNRFENYEISDFHDPVHLNGFGGKKLFDDIVEKLASNPRLQTAMELAGKELERHRAVASYKGYMDSQPPALAGKGGPI